MFTKQQSLYLNQAGLAGKHIIIVLYSLELGGAERQALLLGRHLLHDQGARVEVWGFINPGRAAELSDEYGIPWRIVPVTLLCDTRLHILKSAFRLGWLLRQACPDIILPYLTPPNILCGLTWRWTGARVCFWNQRNGGIERIEPALEHFAVYMTPWFISNSRQGADFLSQTFKVKSERIRIIYNGLDYADPQLDIATWRRKLQVYRHSFLACMVANLHHGKDHVSLLKAWKKVIDQLTDVNRHAVLVLAGRFDSTDKSLKTLVKDLGLNEVVRFLGQVEDVSGLLKAVDVGILTSPYENYEGCPNAVLEYMISGLPVIGTDIPGIRDVVDVSGYPFLVPIGDVDALTDRILQLVLNPDLRIKLGKANHRRAIAEFSVRRMCENTVTFIQECMYINTHKCQD